MGKKNKKNEFVWKALVDNNENSAEMTAFFENEKNKINVLMTQTDLIRTVAQSKYQSLWLKATQEIFDHQFSNKALGSYECQHKTSTNQIIKLKFSAEERQNVKQILLDFSNSSLATTYHAASHVIESGLIQKLIQFYEVDSYLTQSILDKIKIILPPKSIASKAHATGQFNHELQSVSGQLCQHNLTQLNSQIRKSQAIFEIESELRIELKAKNQVFQMNFQQKNMSLPCLESFIQDQVIEIKKMQRTDHQFNLSFKVLKSDLNILRITTQLGLNKNSHYFKINDVDVLAADHPIKVGDAVTMKWTF